VEYDRRKTAEDQLPELPEVETIVRDLSARIVGRRIARLRVRLNKIVRTGPRRASALAAGETVRRVSRRGKFIVLHLSGDKYLVVHLKMTGQFLWGPVVRNWPEYVHVMVDFDDGKALYYRDIRQFGYFLALSAADYTRWLEDTLLGPDPFQISADDFAAALQRRKGRIKALLLDQKFLSGLGNIYVDECLFAAGIHPLCPADQLDADAARRLHGEMTAILKQAIRMRGSTTRDYVGLAGAAGRYQERHLVYGKTGGYCPTCGTPIRRIVSAGRGTHFCPCCQPEP
jgi:formamidopyrimidine-DNA glycosylase